MFGWKKQSKPSSDRELLEQFEFIDTSKSNGWFKAFFAFVLETAKVLVLAAAIILPIRYFLIQPFYVKGASMEPNFFDSEYLMVNEISYRFSEPQRGDITVFHYPRDPRQFFIKRIVGLPGETVELKDGKVFISDALTGEMRELDESWYIPDETITAVNGSKQRIELDSNKYFLMGDNREHSLDSRNFGPVDRSLIVGKVWFRGWPLNRIAVFH